MTMKILEIETVTPLKATHVHEIIEIYDKRALVQKQEKVQAAAAANIEAAGVFCERKQHAEASECNFFNH